MIRVMGTAFLLMALVTAAHGEIQGEPVEYEAGGTTMKGYLAYDDSNTKKRPGILVVHEWWGHNEYARKRARMLAELGYTALAVDMYGDGKQANHPDDAGKFSGEIRKNMDLGRSRFMAAKKVLQEYKRTDPERIGAIGYCFGGSIVLQMARDGVDLEGVASFHGGLGTTEPAKPGAVKAKILVLHGAADQFIPDEQVEAFKKEMEEAKANFQVITYPGAKHSFTNPEADAYAEKFDIPLGYSADADKQSWSKMKAFFADIFEK